MARNSIAIRGAGEHNLKSVDVDIPRDQLVVVTGVSGSGKSSLAFDTIYAEGQRKYVESLSAYARQFLDQLQKPAIESIEGLPPTIAIEQRGSSHNPRSTVATTTEIYDYLRLLFARIGTPRCWHTESKAAGKSKRSRKAAKDCGHPITGQSATQIIDAIAGLPEGTRTMILAPIIRGKKGHHKEVFANLVKQGYVRARVDGELLDLREVTMSKQGTPFTTKKSRYQQHTIEAVIDRLVIRHDANEDDDSHRQRVADSVELALKLADEGLCIASYQVPSEDGQLAGDWTDWRFSEKYACPNHPDTQLDELEPRLFSFNSPFGACPTCDGLGRVMEFDPDLVVPNEELSISKGAITAWRGGGRRMTIRYNRLLRRMCKTFGIDPDKPFGKLTKAQRQLVLHGTSEADEDAHGMHFEGVLPNLERRWQNTDSDYVKQKLSTYLSHVMCETCHGARLRPEALHVFVTADTSPPADDHDHNATHERAWIHLGLGPGDIVHPAGLKKHHRLINIRDVVGMTIEQATDFFDAIVLDHEQQQIAAPILKEICARLGFMRSVGLGYLTLARATGSLSGGEAQRIRLATQVGSGLVGCCYVLDEPTIGLHQRDNDRLIRTLRHLADIGNTVLVVEHDEDTIRAADHVLDIGPGPGRHGGRIVAQGTVDQIVDSPTSLTGDYLAGRKQIALPASPRKMSVKKQALVVKGARENNLQSIDVAFPLGGIVCVTGVSGSGKSTLVNQILLRAARRALLGSRDKPGQHDRLNGSHHIERLIEVDQSPIGRTPRSNPATYTSLFDSVRNLFAQTRESKVRGYKPGRFSFNVKGGRCEACQGQGVKKIEMHFLPDVFVTCDVCKGKRYNRETLEVRYRGKHIADVLEMTVEQALEFFDSFADVKRLLTALNDVGLSYIQLGQASTTLSGGEAQRVKLATELGKRATGRTLYILDEPTTGLHFDDVRRLTDVLDRLVDAAGGGNTVIVIEHNMDVIKRADWIIDLGPEGGDRGGQVVAQGPPSAVIDTPGSFTGQYLKEHLSRPSQQATGVARADQLASADALVASSAP